MTSGDRGTDNGANRRINWRASPRRPAVLMASGAFPAGAPSARGSGVRQPGYPRSREEFEAWFPDEEACVVYLARLRWPSGFLCPHCGPVDPWLKSRGRLVCPNCRYETTVTAGTLFAGSRKPLRKWFEAAWYFAESQGTMPISSLQRILGLGSYQTAWLWARKLRGAMFRGGLERLRGRVAVSVIQVGEGSLRETPTPHPPSVLVAVALEMRGTGMGRVRVAEIRDADEITLHRFMKETVEEGASLEQDPESLATFPWVSTPSFPGMEAAGRGSARSQVLRFTTLLEQWLASVSRGSDAEKGFAPLLDEFAIHINWRGSRHHGQLFQHLLQAAVRDSIPGNTDRTESR